MTEANQSPAKIIYLGACLIAAVRLAREEDWRNSPRVMSRISDAISMAKRIYEKIAGRVSEESVGEEEEV
ncbi:MAG TPA: hypothetical protein VGK21_04655 [Candidatus Angelobacter sp.]|jgi:hypothetical protein